MRDRLNPAGKPDALAALGDLASRAGRQDEARMRHAEAQRVLARFGSPEAAWEGERSTQPDQR